MIRGTLALILISLSAFAAQAGTLTVTCGGNAYEALDEKNLDKAEFVLQLKTKGPNNPPEIVRITDNYGEDVQSRVARLSKEASSIRVDLKNHDKYEITQLSQCSSIETGSADISFSRYTGGFAGYGMPIKAKCSCLDKEI